jgi:predicted DNA-binding ribbon-helix-helix protein
MSILTIRLDGGKHDRLRQLAASQGISMNRLIDELATVALAQHDAEVRFRTRAAKGSADRGLALLNKLDRRLSKG